jgi:hypothetical protein
MIRRMVVAQRPHCGLQPRQPYTWPAVRGAAAPETAVRTAWSERTLHEQTIMGLHAETERSDRYGSEPTKAKEKVQFTALLIWAFFAAFNRSNLRCQH